MPTVQAASLTLRGVVGAQLEDNMFRRAKTMTAAAGLLASVALPQAALANGHHGGGYGPTLEVFDGARFSGDSRIIEGPIDTMVPLRFNDRTGSVAIQGDGWLLCKDAHFDGPCLVARQSIRDLDRFGLDDEITSARPLPRRNPYPHGTIFGRDYWGNTVFYEADFFGNLSEIDTHSYGSGYGSGYHGNSRYDPHYDPYSDYDRNNWKGHRGPRNAAITLYRDDFFTGSSLGVNRSLRDLSDVYFNDEVSSIRIRSGTWEICTDSRFRGRCEIVNGDVRSLGTLRFNDRISSIRRIDGRGGGGGFRDRPGYGNGYGRGGGRGFENQRPDFGDADVILFEHGGFSGRGIPISSDVSNLGRVGLNDAVSSIKIVRGTWEVCRGTSYSGGCQIIDASTTSLSSIRFNDAITSIRRVNGNRARPGPSPRPNPRQRPIPYMDGGRQDEARLEQRTQRERAERQQAQRERREARAERARQNQQALIYPDQDVQAVAPPQRAQRERRNEARPDRPRRQARQEAQAAQPPVRERPPRFNQDRIRPEPRPSQRPVQRPAPAPKPQPAPRPLSKQERLITPKPTRPPVDPLGRDRGEIH